jgi:hypothetical protein
MTNKRIRKNFLLLVALLLSIMVIGKYAVETNQASAQPKIVMPPPTTLPKDHPPSGNTTTPTFDMARNTLIARTVWPTATQLVISKTTDLSPELATDNKYIVIVVHPNGTNEEMIIGPLAT